jgi:hypothetical protein
MPKSNSPIKPDSKSPGYSIGREGIEKLNQVEGIRQSAESRRMFEEFDRQGLTSEQRRRAIIARHARKT